MILHIDRRLGVFSSIVMLLLAVLGWYIFIRIDRTPPPPPALPDGKKALYGEYLPWEQVKQIFPKYAQCTVQDFETGQQFNVVRRAGSSHADVQPLTARDTEIMKSIYGKWSWRRRAVLVRLIDGRILAGSMNGMPHGAGAVKGNNFNGHFCIHFRGSKTHSSSRVDPAHQAMIWKSAGVLEEELSSTPAPQVVETFFSILDQGDEKLLSAFLIDTGGLYDVKNLTDIEYCIIDKFVAKDETTYTVYLRLRRAGVKGDQTLILSPQMIRQPYWRIRAESLTPLFTRASLQTMACKTGAGTTAHNICPNYVHKYTKLCAKLPLCAARFSASQCFPYRPA